MVQLMLEFKLLRSMGLEDYIEDFCLLGAEKLSANSLISLLTKQLWGNLWKKIKKYLKLQFGLLSSEVYINIYLGAAAGVSFFLLGYPFDYMKTLMQTDDLANKKYKNLRDVFSQRLK